MKRILTLVCLLLCVACIMASCSAKDMTAADYYANAEYEDRYPTLSQASEISDLSKKIFNSSYEDLLVFTNDAEDYEDRKYFIYNATTGSTIRTYKAEEYDSFHARKIWGKTFAFVVTSKEVDDVEKYTFTIYDANGNEVASKALNTRYDASGYVSNNVVVSSDLFSFDGKIYRVSDGGSASVVIDNPFFGSLPTSLSKTEENYYKLSNGSVTVYDTSLNTVYYWEMPSNNYEYSSMNLLSNGNVLVQVMNLLPDDASKYDIFEDGNKYDLESFIVDVENDKVKELDLEYEVSYSMATNLVTAYNDTESIPEGLTDFAVIVYIEDHKFNNNDRVYVNLNPKNASVDFEICPEFDNLPTELAKDYYTVRDDAGDQYILDSNFEIVCKANGLDYNATKNDKYVIMNGNLYNFNLTLAYDYDSDNKELVAVLGHNVILKDTLASVNYKADKVEYYLYNGSLNKIEDYYSYGSQYYVTREYSEKNNTYEYNYYNEDGTKLLTIDDVYAYDSQPSTMYTYAENEGVIVYAVVDEKVTYYKLSK